jgi:hypothetical protein
MRYIHLTTSEIRKLITACPVIAETSKRGGATVKFPIQFVDDSAAIVELQPGGSDEVVTISFKAASGYDSVAFVLGPFTAAKSGTGTATVYTFPIVFISALLDQLLGGNLDSVDLLAEIKWTSALYNGETLAFTWTVQNNVNRGGESVPSYPVTAQTVRLPLVSRLTGGVLATDLDAQLLAGNPDGTVLEVVTYDSTLAGRVGSRWEKDNTRSETVTDIIAGVIICTDGTKLFRV